MLYLYSTKEIIEVLYLQKTNVSSANYRPAEEREAEIETIVFALLGISKHMCEEFEQIAADHNLSGHLAGTLWRIRRSGPIKVSDLARTLSCDMGNLSGVLDRLEEAGLVERVASGTDRRVRLLQLTAKGRRLDAQIENLFKRSRIHNQLERINPRERNALSSILSRVCAGISASAPTSAPTPHIRRLPA